MTTRAYNQRSPLLASLPAWLPPLFFLLLAACFLWRSTFAGDVFLPANLLGHVAPWTAGAKPATLPPWNVLRWDGIAQFYPWRHFSHDTIRSGTLPLWNPYQFCGTPFVANSQSAVFYPVNILFYLLPTDRAFGVSALLHLTLCGWFTYLFLRRVGCSEPAALVGGIVYAFSNWQVQWLQLPTFLATSCWFPLLLRQIYALGERQGDKETRTHSTILNTQYPTPNTQHRASTCGTTPNTHYPTAYCLLPTALIVGLMMLAGHLQIAFYGLLAASLWAGGLLTVRGRQEGSLFAIKRLGVMLAGLALGGMLALPQILPALELSRISHRVGKPSAGGYALYVEYGLPSADLVLLTVPEFFGADYDAGNPYYGFYSKHFAGGEGAVRHNAAETALYVGILPLFLALLAVVRTVAQPKGAKRVYDRRVLFFAGLAGLALLLALGTPLNALFYFLIPGFAQSGSPARCLVLWALALAALAAFGLDSLLRQPPTKRELGTVLSVFCFVFAIGLSLAAQALHGGIANLDALKVPVLGDALARIGLGWARFLLLAAGAAGLFFMKTKASTQAAPPPDASRKQNFTALFPLPACLSIGLVILDLFLTGININPTAAPAAVYPVTPGIQYVLDHAGHDRVLPVNKKWSLNNAPAAVFPPNAAMVYGLHDAQGYDSLLTGQYKAFANTLARPNRQPDGSLAYDASPPEVGNMVFIQDPNAPAIPELGAAYAITLPPSSRYFQTTVTPPTDTVYNSEDEMAVYPLPNARGRAYLLDGDGKPISDASAVTWEQDDPTRALLRVTAAAPATLILADQIYPGWQASIDGKPVPLHRQAQGVFRSVAVPAGAHAVAFVYKPAGFLLGMYLACLACCVLAILGGVHLWARFRR